MSMSIAQFTGRSSMRQQHRGYGDTTRAQQAKDPAALMAASQERCQHDAGSPGLGELVRFSAEPQLAELRCLGGGAVVRQGIGLQPAAAAGTSSGSAAAVTCTDAQVASQDYQLIQHVKEPSIDVTAKHAESDPSVTSPPSV